MGVRHGREYSEILEELTNAIGKIDDFYLFFEMEKEEWSALNQKEKNEVLEALADDVFFGLGEDPQLEVGSSIIKYQQSLHVIEVVQDGDVTTTISLI